SFVLSAVIALDLPACALGDEPEEEGKTVTVEPLKTDIFRDALHKKEISPLRSLRDLRDDPQRTIIILLGEKSVHQSLNEEVLQAVDRGAALLIASDQSSARSQLSNYFGVAITGEVVDAPADDCYLGRPYYPFVVPVDKFAPIDKSSPKSIFQALDSSGP